jgi:putative flippase GtrA
MIKNLFNKYKEIISYLFFGVTTLVNFVSFWAFNKILGESLYLISNVIAWVISVVFAYVTNKLWVFESKSWKFRVLLKEVPEFFAARVFSLCVEECGCWLINLGLINFHFCYLNLKLQVSLLQKYCLL